MASIRVTSKDGTTVFEDNVALWWSSTDGPYSRPTGVFVLRDSRTIVYVASSAQGEDPFLRSDQLYVELYDHDSPSPSYTAVLDKGVSMRAGDFDLTYIESGQYSGFQVTKDPGNLLIWISSSLFVIGLVTVFYFPHRQIWTRVYRLSNGDCKLAIVGSSGRTLTASSEFESFVNEVGDGLTSGDASYEAGKE